MGADSPVDMLTIKTEKVARMTAGNEVKISVYQQATISSPRDGATRIRAYCACAMTACPRLIGLLTTVKQVTTEFDIRLTKIEIFVKALLALAVPPDGFCSDCRMLVPS